MLSDRRRYFRANFSSTTTPISSGGRAKDAFGNEYARIPLQLPGNLVDQTKRPREIEMVLTKLSIPLGAVPVAKIDVANMDYTAIFGSHTTHIETKGLVTIWPFNIDTTGGVFPDDYDRNLFVVPTAHNGRIRIMQYPLQNIQMSTVEASEKLTKIKNDGFCPFYNAEDLMEFLTENVTEAFHACIRSSPTTSEIERACIVFAEIASRLHIKFQRHGGYMSVVPWNRHSTRVESQLTYYPVDMWETDASGTITSSFQTPHVGFSIAVNKHVRDLIPNLPWRPINNSTLRQYDFSSHRGQSIPEWEELNDGDSYFYVLDTYSGDCYINDEGMFHGSDSTHFRRSNELDIVFDGVNLVSAIPINSFIVTFNGVSMTMQTFPVNISPVNAPSALTTSIPIIEVYYPLWNSISDKSTNLVISKDAFTNAAPFTLGSDALTQRNIQFQVFYVFNDGRMAELTIPPNSSLSIQVCYSITYY
jgi:hypothetical protein